MSKQVRPIETFKRKSLEQGFSLQNTTSLVTCFPCIICRHAGLQGCHSATLKHIVLECHSATLKHVVMDCHSAALKHVVMLLLRLLPWEVSAAAERVTAAAGDQQPPMPGHDHCANLLDSSSQSASVQGSQPQQHQQSPMPGHDHCANLLNSCSQSAFMRCLQPEQHQQGTTQVASTSAAEFGSHAWYNPLYQEGQEGGTLQPTEELLPAVLPDSSDADAAPMMSAAVHSNIASMQLSQLGFISMAEPHTAMLGQHQPLGSPPVPGSPDPQAQGVVRHVAAGHSELACGKQASQHQLCHHHHSPKLPSLVLDAVGSSQAVPKEAAQVLRRRISFTRSSQVAELQRLQNVGMHSLDSHVSKGGTDLLPVQADKDQSVSCSGNRLLAQSGSLSKHRSSKVTVDGLLGEALHAEEATEPDIFADLAPPTSGHHFSSVSLHHSSSSPEFRPPSKKRQKSAEVVMCEALRQTTAQVRTCRLQLQKQQSEQHSMQKVLQVMTAQVGAMLDKPNFYVEQQAHSHFKLC